MSRGTVIWFLLIDLEVGKMGGLGVFNVIWQGSMEFSGLVHGKEALAHHLVCDLHYG